MRPQPVSDLLGGQPHVPHSPDDHWTIFSMIPDAGFEAGFNGHGSYYSDIGGHSFTSARTLRHLGHPPQPTSSMFWHSGPTPFNTVNSNDVSAPRAPASGPGRLSNILHVEAGSINFGPQLCNLDHVGFLRVPATPPECEENIDGHYAGAKNWASQRLCGSKMRGIVKNSTTLHPKVRCSNLWLALGGRQHQASVTNKTHDIDRLSEATASEAQQRMLAFYDGRA